MDSNKLGLMIFCVAVVTYIPRALPALLVGKLQFSRKVEKFLNLIPYTAMAALIFPGIFSVDAEHPAVGLAGGAVAAVLAWRKCPVMVCVLAAVATDFLLYQFCFGI